MDPTDLPDEPGRLRWADWRDRWPNARASRAVRAAGLAWHVQTLGAGAPVLLLHGTGGATHSWAPLAARLAPHARLVVPDLPGHGFTGTPTPDRLSLAGMAADVAALLGALDVRPRLVVGHSAGVAVLLRMLLDGALPDAAALVGFAPALTPPPGLAGSLLAPLAAPLARSGLAAQLAAGVASLGGVVPRLLATTGSRLPPAQQGPYAALAGSSAHTGAALTMMANWVLAPLVAALPGVTIPVTLALGARDAWIPGDGVRAIARRLPHAVVVEIPDAGHLAHEEAPDAAARIVRDAGVAAGALPPAAA